MKPWRVTIHWADGGYQWQTVEALHLPAAIVAACKHPELLHPAIEASKIVAWELEA